MLALLCLSADARPRLPPQAEPARPAYEGGPTPLRGSLKKKPADLPTLSERGDAIADGGTAAQLPEVAWARVSVRDAHVPDRAALVFTGADAVDGKRNLAAWGMGMAAKYQAPAPPPEATVSRALQVWLRAKADRRYAVVCRAVIADAVGDIVVTGDGGFTLIHHIDHTGQSKSTFSFLVDPQADGWYRFTIESADAWSTSGCTIDELP